MQIVIGARDTLGVTHRFQTSLDSLDEMSELKQEAIAEMKEGGALAHVVLIGIPGGKA